MVGFIVGATGVGGGSLMTPLLTLVFNVPAQIAVGTDLLFAAITKSGGVLAHTRRGNIQWSITGWLVAGSVPAALLTLGAVAWLKPDAQALAQVMTRALSIALVLTAAGLVFKTQIQALGRRLAGNGLPETRVANARLLSMSVAGAAALPAPNGPQPGAAVTSAAPANAARPLPTLCVGLVIGCLVALTSVGAGVLGVVALFFLYPMLPARQIVGADIAHAVPLTLVAGAGHAAMGSVDWSLLGSLIIGSLPAIYVGSAVASRLPERFLRGFLALMLVLIGLKLFFK